MTKGFGSIVCRTYPSRNSYFPALRLCPFFSRFPRKTKCLLEQSPFSVQHYWKVPYRSFSSSIPNSSVSNHQEELTWQYDYDVLIVGGGIVGSSLAVQLGNAIRNGILPPSFKVGILETRKPKSLGDLTHEQDDDTDVKIDPRTYSITPK